MITHNALGDRINVLLKKSEENSENIDSVWNFLYITNFFLPVILH